MLFEELGYLGTVLVRNEPHRYLGVGCGRKDGLGAFSCVAAPDAAYVKAGTYSGAFHGGVALFSLDFLYAEEFLVLVEVERSPGKLGAVCLAEVDHIVVEAFYFHLAVFVDQR